MTTISETSANFSKRAVGSRTWGLFENYGFSWSKSHVLVGGQTYYGTYKPQGSAEVEFAYQRDYRDKPTVRSPAAPTEFSAQSNVSGAWAYYHYDADRKHSSALGGWRDVMLLDP